MVFTNPITKSQTILLGGALAILTVVGSYLYQRRKNRLPTTWEPVGEVKGLCLYPLKSGKRKHVRSAECTKLGLQEIRKDEKVYKLRDR